MDLTTLLIPPLVMALAGSVHCVAMCGGLLASCGALRGGGRSGLPLYHLGRITTYSVLGAAAGLTGSAAGLEGPVLDALRLGAALLSALLLLGVAANLAGALPWHFSWTPGPVRRGLAAAMRRGGAAGALAMGAFSGLLPCGLLHAGLALALIAGGAAQGALVMAAFGLGTLPSLGTAGALLGRLQRWKAGARGRVAMASAVLLVGGTDLVLRWPRVGGSDASTTDGRSADCPLHPAPGNR